MNTPNPSTAYPGIESFPCFVVGQHSVKRQRRAQANREARNRGWVAEWRTLGADPLEDRAVRIEREPPEMRPWAVRQTSDNVRREFLRESHAEVMESLSRYGKLP